MYCEIIFRKILYLYLGLNIRDISNVKCLGERVGFEFQRYGVCMICMEFGDPNQIWGVHLEIFLMKADSWSIFKGKLWEAWHILVPDDTIHLRHIHPNALPRCERCGIQVPTGRLNTRHFALEKCKKGKESRIRRNTLQHCFKASRVWFQINAETLPPLEAFPYLGWTIA